MRRHRISPATAAGPGVAAILGGVRSLARSAPPLSVLARSVVLSLAFTLFAVSPALATFPGSNGNVLTHDYYLGTIDGSGPATSLIPDEDRVASPSNDYEEDPDLSPDGTSILYSKIGTGIFKKPARPDGEPVLLIPHPQHTNCGFRSPTWAPSSTAFAFVLYCGDASPNSGSWIQVADADGSNVRTLASGVHPAWSPNGARLAYVSPGARTSGPYNSIADPGDLHVMNPDGTDPRTIVAGGAHPSWSPDGTRLAFSRWHHENGRTSSDLYTVRADGTEPQLLVRKGITPVWSPDGASIAYAYINDGYGDGMYNVRADGSCAQKVRRFGGWPVAWARGSGSSTPPCPLTVSEKAARFRPILRFDSGEKWRPLNVESLIGSRQFVTNNPVSVCTKATALCSPFTSWETLNAHQSTDAEHTETHLQLNPAGSAADDYRTLDADCSGDGGVSELNGLLDCDVGPRSSIYYNRVLSDGGYEWYDYWWFYRFNEYPTLGFDHEGDWEGVSVAASPNASTFDFASFAQHAGVFSYLRENLECDAGGPQSCGQGTTRKGGRVHAFVAGGTHASYPKPCSDACLQDGGSFVPETHFDGRRPWGRNDDAAALIPFPGVTAGRADFSSWVFWRGRWGQGSSAPKSPGHQSRFRRPWASQCASGNDGCDKESPPPVVIPDRSVATASRRKHADVRNASNRRCSAWFGSGVVAAGCVRRTLAAAVERKLLGRRGSWSLSVQRGRASASRGARSVEGAAVVGIAQTMGAPLGPQDVLRIRSSRGGVLDELLVRVRGRRGVRSVRVTNVKVARGQSAQLRISNSGTVHVER